MKTRTCSLALALAFTGLTAPLVMAEEIPLPKLYKSLADKNHYPAAEGLTSAQADVKCAIFDTVLAAFPDAAGKPIAVRFYWSRPTTDAAPKKKLAASGIPESLTDLSARAGKIFQEATDFVIADPIYWTIAATEAKASNEGGRITVTGTARSPSDQIKKLEVIVDATSYQVSRMMMDLGQAQLTFEMTNKELGGKWGVETETITYPQYKKVLKYEYAQVEAFWLPSKLTIEFQGPDGKPVPNTPPYVFELSNWQVNKGMPEGAF